MHRDIFRFSLLASSVVAVHIIVGWTAKKKQIKVKVRIHDNILISFEIRIAKRIYRKRKIIWKKINMRLYNTVKRSYIHTNQILSRWSGPLCLCSIPYTIHFYLLPVTWVFKNKFETNISAAMGDVRTHSRTLQNFRSFCPNNIFWWNQTEKGDAQMYLAFCYVDAFNINWTVFIVCARIEVYR